MEKDFQTYFINAYNILIEWLQSPGFYYQLGLVLLMLLISFTLSGLLRKRLNITEHQHGSLNSLKQVLSKLIFPVFIIFSLSVAVDISDKVFNQSQLSRVALSLAFIFVLLSIINDFIEKQLFRVLALWLLVPVALLNVFGVLSPVTEYLDKFSIELGSIRISAYNIARLIIFGSILFWLGRISNNIGQQIIRNQQDLEIGTREVVAKLFQVLLSVVVFVLMLQLMGVNLTALAVFGGALGVGLGFGLQAIASNFISGIIILIDRSLSVGDYVEMEDGRAGTIRELNMRSTTLETYDGKDIMVPNEQFITTSFTNWTHKNHKQRYTLEFRVSYQTDLHEMIRLVKTAITAHPQVISGDDTPIEELPDVEVVGFGDSGVDIQVEFWMEGIDDGVNRVGSDLNLIIWDTLRHHNIDIPFPQREVTIIDKTGV